MVDEMQKVFQLVAVRSDEWSAQNSTCERDLDTQVQPDYGVRPNIFRQARAACGPANLRILPSELNGFAGLLSSQLNRADCVKAGCSLIRHDELVPYASTGACSGQWNTRNRIDRASLCLFLADALHGLGDRRDTAETPAHELPVNEAHARFNAKAGQTPAEGGAERRRNCHKRTTSREPRIKTQAVRVRARAAGREACPKGRCISSALDARNKLGPQQEHGDTVPVWSPQAMKAAIKTVNQQTKRN